MLQSIQIRRSRNVALVAVLLAALAAALDGSAVTAQPAGADLQVMLDVAPPSGVSPNGKLTYTATVTNLGPSAANGVVLTVTLPQGVIPVSATPGACAFAVSSASVTCGLGAIPATTPPTTVTAMIVVHPITIGMKTATARATASTPDPLPGNNIDGASSALTEVSISDVEVKLLEDRPDPLRVGETLVYYITVRNIHDDTARDVVLIDALPASVTVLSASASQGACAVVGTTVTCSLGNINPTLTADVKLAVRPTVAGFLYNTAGVGMSTVDPDITNNSATARTWVNP
jgi:uncharacterized repeat protein (TIGR01451 family)